MTQSVLVVLALLLAPSVAPGAAAQEAPDALRDLRADLLSRAEEAFAAARPNATSTDAADAQNALRALRDAVENGEVLSVPAAYGQALALVEFARAYRSAHEDVDWFYEGREGCSPNSTCMRYMAAASLAANASRDAVAEARRALDASFANLSTARALELAVVAEAALDDAEGQLATFPSAQGDVTRQRSFDPQSSAFRRLLLRAWTTAHAPAYVAEAAGRVAELAVAADAEGAPLDPEAQGRVREAALALFARASGLGEESREAAARGRADAPNATYPGLAATYLRFRTANEYDRLLFAFPDESQAVPRLTALLETNRAAAAAARERARESGYAGLLLDDALARSERFARTPAESFLARANAVLDAAVETQGAFLDPALAAAADTDEPPPASAPIAPVAAALAVAALAGVAGTAFLRRRKA